MKPVLRRILRTSLVIAPLVLIIACESVSRQFDKVVRFIDGQDRIEMEGSTAAVTPLISEDGSVFASPSVEGGAMEPPVGPEKQVSTAQQAVKVQPAPTPQARASAVPRSVQKPLNVDGGGADESRARQKIAKTAKATPNRDVRQAPSAALQTATLTGQVLVQAGAKGEGEQSNKSLVRLIPRGSDRVSQAAAAALVAPAQSAHFMIDMKDKEYQPRYLSAKKNDTVVFTNSDKIRHNVFSRSGKNAFDLGTYTSGKKRGVTFKEAGIVKVYCNIHPNMATFVSVIDEGYSTITDEEGRFTFEALPAGEYVLEAWNIRGSVDTIVNIRAAQQAQVELLVSELDPEFLEHSNKFGEQYPDKPVLFGDEFY